MTRNFLLAAVIALSSGCASRGEMSLMQRDVDDLRTSLTQLERNLATLKTETRDIADKSRTDTAKDLEAVRKGTADVQANLDAMRIDVQLLTGKLEEQAGAAKKPLEDIALFREDTLKMITAIQERLKKLETDNVQFEKKVAAIAKSAEVPPTAEALYKQAQDTLTAGDTSKARQLYGRFSELFPGHKLAPNVQYWIGESWYVEKNYEQAVLEFQKVIKDYPGKEKVSAAMLKQAMAFKEMGDSKSARFVLKEMLDKYPNSEESPAAKDLLITLK